jgi:hypothetical protein
LEKWQGAPSSRILFIGLSKRLKTKMPLAPNTSKMAKGSRVRCSPSHLLVRLRLDPHVTSKMVSRALPTVTPPPVLRPNWETVARLASMRSKPLDLSACLALSSSSVGFVAQPTNCSTLGFEAQTKKPS